MVSLAVEESAGRTAGGPSLAASNGAPTPPPSGRRTRSPPEATDDTASLADALDDAATCGSPFESSRVAALKRQHRNQLQQQQALQQPLDQTASNSHDDNSSSGEPDDEQLRKILTCKRLSEGCVNRFNATSYVARKNSLHLIGEGLPPVTEGEAMLPSAHMSYQLSQSVLSNADSSAGGSSMSLRGGGSTSSSSSASRHSGGFHLGAILKRNSQDENATSCSSSTSLDGPRSPSRRRSSTVSQCSSVLSEGTRQQLNFDMSPDLPLESSLLEANAVESPTDFERPASPEPVSPMSAGGADLDSPFELRPMSRLSQCDELMLAAESPDSTLGDSNQDSAAPPTRRFELLAGSIGDSDGRRQWEARARPAGQRHEPTSNSTASETRAQAGADHLGTGRESNIRASLERLIDDVSTVKVSNGRDTKRHQLNRTASTEMGSSQKRAHTPLGADFQRHKLSPS